MPSSHVGPRAANPSTERSHTATDRPAIAVRTLPTLDLDSQSTQLLQSHPRLSYIFRLRLDTHTCTGLGCPHTAVKAFGRDHATLADGPSADAEPSERGPPLRARTVGAPFAQQLDVARQLTLSARVHSPEMSA